MKVNVASKYQCKFYKLYKDVNFNLIILYKIHTIEKPNDLSYNLIKINEILRTYIYKEENKDEYYQLVKDIDELDIEINYIYTNSKEKIYNKLNSYRFSLERDSTEPLLKFTVICEDNNMYLYILTHHICFDGFSERILLEQINNYYNNTLNYPLKTYIDFTNYVYEYVEKNKDICSVWWENYTKTHNSYLNYINIEGKSVLYEQNFKLQYFKLNNTLKIKNFAKKNRVTVYSLVLALFQLYLYKNFNLKITTIRVPLRNRPEEYNIIGSLMSLSFIIREIKENDSLINISRNNMIDLLKISDISMYDSEYIKTHFKNTYNGYMLCCLNDDNLKQAKIGDGYWEVIDIDNIPQGDMYIDIKDDDNIYLVYNYNIFKDTINTSILEELINTL